MQLFSVPIVGAHFRPPAKQLLTVLPLGSPLILEPEPENPYDPDAIRILVRFSAVYPIARWDLLTNVLQGTGYEPQDLINKEKAEGPLHLGYIPRSGAKTALGGPGNQEIGKALAQDGGLKCTLGIAPEGHPVVNIQLQGSSSPG